MGKLTMIFSRCRYNWLPVVMATLFVGGMAVFLALILALEEQGTYLVA